MGFPIDGAGWSAIPIFADDHDDDHRIIPTSDMVTMGFLSEGDLSFCIRRRGLARSQEPMVAASWSRVWSISRLMVLGLRSTIWVPSRPLPAWGVARRTTLDQ